MKIGGLRTLGVSPVADGGIDLVLLDGVEVFPEAPIVRRLRRLPPADQPREVGRLTIRLEVDPEHPDDTTGRVIGLNVTFTEPVDPGELRTVPWNRLVAAATASLRARNSNTIAAWQAAGHARVAVQPGHQPTAKPLGRPPLSPSHYQDVADQYRKLIEAGEAAPTQRLAELHHVSRNTAAGWLVRARKQGFLNPATRGKAG